MHTCWSEKYMTLSYPYFISQLSSARHRGKEGRMHTFGSKHGRKMNYAMQADISSQNRAVILNQAQAYVNTAIHYILFTYYSLCWHLCFVFITGQLGNPDVLHGIDSHHVHSYTKHHFFLWVFRIKDEKQLPWKHLCDVENWFAAQLKRKLQMPKIVDLQPHNTHKNFVRNESPQQTPSAEMEKTVGQ